LSTCGLRIGAELNNSELEEYRELGETSMAYDLAIRFLHVRPRTRHEMSEYLKRKNITGEIISSNIQRLENAGLLNDDAFAASWVASRRALKPRSKWMLERELMEKGVSSESISSALHEIDPESELKTLVEVVRRKRQQSVYQDTQKLIAYLGRQGYSYELIKRALEQLD
jgi:regulatory protein